MNFTTKPTVHYTDDLELMWTKLGYVARIIVTDHPKLGMGEVRTSRILRIDFETGVFETLNTYYVPEGI
jgi:hypothetical protein